MTFRTPTIRRNTNPVWNRKWILGNVPASGFELKCLVNDEDAADHDDKLGIATVHVNSIQDDWPGIKEQGFKVKMRKASKRVYVMRKVASLARPQHDHRANLVVSVELVGKTQGNAGAHVYTVGPNYWFQHLSPLIGVIAGTKDEIHGGCDGDKMVTHTCVCVLSVYMAKETLSDHIICVYI